MRARNNLIIKDHLGNTFNTYKEMCEKYGISFSSYSRRVNVQGWTVEDALTKPCKIIRAGKEIKDHLGNVYESIEDLSNTYGISAKVLRSRLSNNWDIKDALLTPVRSKHKCVNDHLGNEYTSVKDMCKAYNIDKGTFITRINRMCWTLEEALTTPVKEKHRGKVTDHLGREYKSKKDMCREYNISYKAYQDRILNREMSLEDVLTTPVRLNKREIDIPNIGKFSSVTECCKCLNISITEVYRGTKNGISIEQSILELSKGIKSITTDHNGKEYKSVEDMCKSYNISTITYRDRLNLGWTQREALLVPRLKHGISRSYIGIDGKQYYKIGKQYLNSDQIIEYKKQGILE